MCIKFQQLAAEHARIPQEYFLKNSLEKFVGPSQLMWIKYQPIKLARFWILETEAITLKECRKERFFRFTLNFHSFKPKGFAMTYKTILVHVDQSKHAATRIKIAAQIAITDNAHLVGAAMTGISRFIYQDSAFGVSGSIVATHIDALNESAKQALAEFESIAKSMGVLSYETRLVDDEPEGGLVLQARYSDLVVVSQTDPDDSLSRLFSDLPEYVMLNCARPVLVVPYAGRFNQIGSNVLVAWDGSMEATRSISNAIPLLKRAKKVTIVVFNSTARYDTHGEQPGADIALFLARHNVKVEVLQQTTSEDIGNALLSLAADMQSDLLVMGGYGHTRFREVLLGGVTMTLLKTMTVPVVMSH
jgi:nucleotide-binding universal stress UspA family protein